MAPFWHHFETFGRPIGVPGASLGGFVDLCWAALSPKVQNENKRGLPSPKSVICGYHLDVFIVACSMGVLVRRSFDLLFFVVLGIA